MEINDVIIDMKYRDIKNVCNLLEELHIMR